MKADFRRFKTLAGALLISCALALASFGAQYRHGPIVTGAGGGFVCSLPLTHTYTPGAPGTGSETICTNATQVIVEVWGPGGPGALRASSTNNGGGGGGGGYSKSTKTTGLSAGGTISYSVAASAPNAGQDVCSNPSAGSASTAGGTGQLVNLTANAGGPGTITPTGGAGGTASGGDTNTTGTAGSSTGAGGAGASGGAGGAAGGGSGTPPGGGGGGNKSSLCGDSLSAGDGAAGQVKISWS